VEKSSSLSSALEDVRNGDVTIAVEQDGDKIIAHYSDADQVVSAVARGTLYSFIQSSNIAASGQSPKYSLQSERIEDESLKTIQFMTPGLLGWAIATSATFGAAATLVGWRSTKLLRRIRLSPVSTTAVVSARIGVTMVIALMQMAIFLVLGVAVFGLQLTGSWYMAVPLVLCGTLAFMSLGLLAGSVSKTVEGATSLANIFVLPMAFLSGSFGPTRHYPQALRALGDALPLKYLLDAVNGIYLHGQELWDKPTAIAVLAGWGALGIVVAMRKFRWEPREG
jgi:ABC-2 type transport system permease protein